MVLAKLFHNGLCEKCLASNRSNDSVFRGSTLLHILEGYGLPDMPSAPRDAGDVCSDMGKIIDKIINIAC